MRQMNPFYGFSILVWLWSRICLSMRQFPGVVSRLCCRGLGSTEAAAVGWTNAGGLRACASADNPPPAGLDIHSLKAKVLRGFKIDPWNSVRLIPKIGVQYPRPTNMVAPKSVALLTLLLQGWTVDVTLSWHTNFDIYAISYFCIFQRLKHQFLSGYSSALHIKY